MVFRKVRALQQIVVSSMRNYLSPRKLLLLLQLLPLQVLILQNPVVRALAFTRGPVTSQRRKRAEKGREKSTQKLTMISLGAPSTRERLWIKSSTSHYELSDSRSMVIAFPG